MDISSEPIKIYQLFYCIYEKFTFLRYLDNAMGRLHTEGSSSTVDFSSQQVFQSGNDKTSYSMKLIVIYDRSFIIRKHYLSLR